MTAYTGDDGWSVLFSEFGVLRWMREWREWATHLLNKELYHMKRMQLLRAPASYREYLPGGSEGGFIFAGPGHFEDRVFYSAKYQNEHIKDWLSTQRFPDQLSWSSTPYSPYRRYGLRRLGPGY